jgi:hypothetical protein
MSVDQSATANRGLASNSIGAISQLVTDAIAMAKPRNGHEHSAGFEPLLGRRVVPCEEKLVPRQAAPDRSYMLPAVDKCEVGRWSRCARP